MYPTRRSAFSSMHGAAIGSESQTRDALTRLSIKEGTRGGVGAGAPWAFPCVLVSPGGGGQGRANGPRRQGRGEVTFLSDYLSYTPIGRP